MCFIKTCEKSIICNFKERREYMSIILDNFVIFFKERIHAFIFWVNIMFSTNWIWTNIFYD